jgi:hypothetical protein
MAVTEFRQTTSRMVALYEAMTPQVQSLLADIAPRAQKRPEGMVSPVSVASVNRVLVLVRKVVSRLPQAGLVVPLPETGAVTHADLALALSLAGTALSVYRETHGCFDEDGEWLWFTLDC